jgi:hypothetical protein
VIIGFKCSGKQASYSTDALKARHYRFRIPGAARVSLTCAETASSGLRAVPSKRGQYGGVCVEQKWDELGD